MSLSKRYYNVEDTSITEEEKSDYLYLSQSVDFYIAAMVREKTHIKQARNLYDGIRDKDEFRYLEEVFGIETPVSVKMTPLIKTRIDVLVGILLDEVFTYRISVNDADTLTNIEDQKRKLKAKEIVDKWKKFHSDNVDLVNKGEQPKASPYEEDFLKKLEHSLNESFISEFEIAAGALLKFFEQDPTIDIKQKIKQFFVDMLIAGEAYYRVYIEHEGEDPKLEICKPENVFYSKNTNHQFLSAGNQPLVNAVVHRFFLKRSEILSRWGHLMTDEQKVVLFAQADAAAAPRIRDPRQLDHIYNYGNNVLNQHTNSTWDTLPVYHVEWLANNEVELTEEEQTDLQIVETLKHNRFQDPIFGKEAGNGKPNKKGYRLDRYEGVRVGWNVYLNMGKSRWMPRSIGAPYLTTLSYNGVTYNDRSSKPYSMTLACKDLQDSYDVVTFFRDNLIANAGVDGSRVNLAAIPKVLGQDFMERLLKFVAFRKQGLELYDPTEEGASLFQHYGDFRGSLNGNIIEQLNMVLESIQAQADVVTGINRHMYAAAEARDAVTNVQAGVKQTSLITKDIFELLFDSRKHLLVDLLNAGKITYKNGKRGSYIVGHRTVLFHAQPENFKFTDFNIQVINSSRENLKFEKLNALLPQLAGKGTIEDEVLVQISLMDSPTEVRQLAVESMARRKEENNQIKQLQEQLQQMQSQSKQLQEELQKTTIEKEKLETADREYKMGDLAMRKKESEERIRQGDERLALDREIDEAEIKKDAEVVRLEREQLYANNVPGNAKQVKNDL